MKPTTLSSLLALTLAGSAGAASPYDMPYGNQWNFMIGTSGADMGGGSRIAVTSDGTVFVQNRTGVSTWGDGTGGNVRGGLGAITSLGSLLYGTTVSSLPTMNAAGQQYAAGVHAVGNKAYFTCYGAQGQYWTGEDGKDANRAMVWSLDSSGLDSIADQHSLSKYTNATGNPLRTDALQPTSTGLTPAAGQNRIAASDLRDSTLDMVMVNDMVNGDFGTLDDYGGYDLNMGTSLGNAYQPGIGVYNFTTNTLSGPAKQPTVTYTGAAATWSNHSTYTTAGIDQNTGSYYGAGPSHARTSSTSTEWDPDGSGPAASIPFVNSTSSANTAGIGTAYDAANTLLYSVTWDTTGYDYINFIAPTNDSSNSAFWAGEKLDDCYIELRDASGAVVWSDSFDMSPSAGDPPVPGVERIASVKEDANGDLLVTGYFENGGAGGGASTYDNFVRKYKKTAPNTYTVQWTTTSGLADVRDLAYDTAFDLPDKTLYLLADTFGQWTNPSGFVYAGNSDLLVQKLSPGDFNTDGLVDFADVQLAGTATKPGLTGVDTYDFDGDGDSTLADTTYMITKIMDRAVGDIAQDLPVTDVDNADIGKAIGASGSGTLYLDGDMDWDGDVESDDITAVAGAFTGAKTPGKYTAGTPGATLLYSADGKVSLLADEAAGGIITSFQLENNQGTFVAASYNGPTGGSFGGSLKDVTTSVIADTDLTLAGFSGTLNLGNVFPIGMDQAGLEAYLTTAVYTGQPGSGQMQFKPVFVVPPVDYETWAASFPALTDPNPSLDFELDGLATGIEYVVGGNPTLNDAATVAPTSESTESGSVFTYRRTDLANGDPITTIVVEYSSNLTDWAPAQDGVEGVIIAESDNFYESGIDQVMVTLPPNLAVNGRLFARLKVSIIPPVTLFNVDFETDDGGFTVVNTTGTPWEHGDPQSTDPGAWAVTEGNGGSAKCWGTNLVDVYAAGTDTSLRSPMIDLTGVTAATLSFARAIDAPITDPKHTLEVNVIDATTEVKTTVIAAFEDPETDASPWGTLSVPIPAEALGKTVYLEWRFVGNGDGQHLGAYIDDVVVTAP